MEELTAEQIEANKQEFLSLVDSIKIEGALIPELKEFLEKSDFFIAPASTKFHAAYFGGLCQHSLNVYHTLLDLVDKYASHIETHTEEHLLPDGTKELSSEEVLVRHYSEDTLKIVALFHDLSKTNYYENYMRNVNTGEKNEKGKDIWIQVPEFRVRPGTERFVAVNHEVNSYILISRFIPLSEEELIAISNHHCCTGDGNTNSDLSYILDQYPLLTLLHSADFISTYIKEKIKND